MLLSKRIKDISPSPTLKITSRAKQLKLEGKDVVSFAAGEPDFDTPDVIKKEAINAINSGFTKYTPTTGIPDLKLAISHKFRKENHLNYEVESIVVSCGAKHSLYNTLQVLCDVGDEVVIASPYWVSYPEMVKLAGASVVIVETKQEDNFKLTEKSLRKAITPKTKAIIINSPSNPTGCVYDEDELRLIADIAVSKNIFVISDEIYEKIIYEGSHISIGSLNEKIFNLTVTINGVSKSYSMTGWRIGYLGAPGEVALAIGNLQDHSTSNPSSISQRAALAALKLDKSFTDSMVSEFKRRRDYMASRINNMKVISCFKPCGAFYVYCDISKTKHPAGRLCEKLLNEALIAVIPGEGFGSISHVRFSFAVSLSDIKKGMDRLEQWLAKQ